MHKHMYMIQTIAIELLSYLDMFPLCTHFFKCVQNGNKLNPLMRLFRKYVCHLIQCVKIPSNELSYYDVFINRQM